MHNLLECLYLYDTSDRANLNTYTIEDSKAKAKRRQLSTMTPFGAGAFNMLAEIDALEEGGTDSDVTDDIFGSDSD